MKIGLQTQLFILFIILALSGQAAVFFLAKILFENDPTYFWYGSVAVVMLESVLFSGISFYIIKSVMQTLKKMVLAISPVEQPQKSSIAIQDIKNLEELREIFHLVKEGIDTNEEELKYQSRHDSVTGLPNRLYFLEHLVERLKNADPEKDQMGIITISIHRFSEITHILGHPIADRLLHHVGARLIQHIPHAEVVALLSHHVFIVLLPNLNQQNYQKEVEHINALFEKPFSVYTVNIDLDNVMGISFYPQDSVDADTLIQKSDVALFAAKDAPEHYAVYRSEKDPYHFNKLSLMSELRDGITQNEFEMYFQPQIHLATSKIVQVEALVRWQHPKKGFMPPLLFIPLAEETGHIKKLTLWVLEKSIAQCSVWHKNNIPLGVSINLSVKDLLNKDLYAYISHLLQMHPLDPQWITLEITESSFMHDPDSAIAAIRKLSQLGVHFSVDDFGTGYSSLSYLKKIPVKELKIDKSFTEDIKNNERVARLARCTIDMGHSLDLKVVAEGIEDMETYQMLKGFGCDLGQGYLFSKPISSAELSAWLKTSSWGLPS